MDDFCNCAHNTSLDVLSFCEIFNCHNYTFKSSNQTTASKLLGFSGRYRQKEKYINFCIYLIHSEGTFPKI